MRKITYREGVIEALREEMRRDERVYCLGEDIAEFGGSYKTTAGLLQEFGKERVRNTPISAQRPLACAWRQPSALEKATAPFVVHRDLVADPQVTLHPAQSRSVAVEVQGMRQQRERLAVRIAAGNPNRQNHLDAWMFSRTHGVPSTGLNRARRLRPDDELRPRRRRQATAMQFLV